MVNNLIAIRYLILIIMMDQSKILTGYTISHYSVFLISDFKINKIQEDWELWLAIKTSVFACKLNKDWDQHVTVAKSHAK